jgi:hypothetical protein
MKHRNPLCALLLAAIACLYVPASHAVMIDVYARTNSTSGGAGASTGVVLAAGEAFSVSVDAGDLWNAGQLPRWSNADGLTTTLLATGSDDSGLAAGTPIGAAFGNLDQFGLSLPYGTLVGSLGGSFFALGTNFSGNAVASGELLLWYWDSNASDNTEFVTANVERTGRAVPEPATLSLLVGGVGFVSSARYRRRRR